MGSWADGKQTSIRLETPRWARRRTAATVIIGNVRGLLSGALLDDLVPVVWNQYARHAEAGRADRLVQKAPEVQTAGYLNSGIALGTLDRGGDPLTGHESMGNAPRLRPHRFAQRRLGRDGVLMTPPAQNVAAARVIRLPIGTWFATRLFRHLRSAFVSEASWPRTHSRERSR